MNWDLQLGIFVATIVLVSSQCPPLQPPQGIVIACVDKNNGTIDCLSNSVPQGILGQYRCANGSDSSFANSTLKCGCRRRWKGLEEFNAFATSSCGSLPMTLPTPTGDNMTGSGENESLQVGNPSALTSELNSGMNETNTSPANSTEPTVEKSSVPNLEMQGNSSSSSDNSTTLTTTPSSIENSSNGTGNSSSSSTMPSPDLSTISPTNSSNATSTIEPAGNLTTLSPGDASSSSSSQDNSSSTPSTTLLSVDNSSTTISSLSLSAGNSSSNSSLTDNNSSTTTATPSNFTGDQNTTLEGSVNSTLVDDTGSRESKDLKLTTTNNGTQTSTNSPNGDTTTTTPSTLTSNDTSSETNNSSLPTTGATLAVTNSSVVPSESSAPSNTSVDPKTTTPSSSSSSSSDSLTTTPSSTTTVGVDSENATSPGDGSIKDFQKVALDLHNKIRKNHDSQPLSLNQTLSQIAQTWADTLLKENKLLASPGKRSYAENLFKISGNDNISDESAVQSAMKSWISSMSWFNYTNPKPTGLSQIIWNATTQLGVGLASGNDTSIVVATYYPRGNIISVGSKSDPTFYFKKNVFPEISNPEEVFPSMNSNSTSQNNATAAT